MSGTGGWVIHEAATQNEVYATWMFAVALFLVDLLADG